MEDKIDKIEKSRLKSHFYNLFSIALADSTIDPLEIKFLYDLGVSRGFDKNEIDYIIENPHKVRFFMPQTVYEKIEQLYDLVQMMLADGIVEPREIVICEAIGKKIGFMEENIRDLIDFLIEECKKGTPKNELIETVKENLK